MPVAVGDRARQSELASLFPRSCRARARGVPPMITMRCGRRHTLCNVLYVRRTRTPPVQRPGIVPYVPVFSACFAAAAACSVLPLCHACADIWTMQICIRLYVLTSVPVHAAVSFYRSPLCVSALSAVGIDLLPMFLTKSPVTPHLRIV